MRSTAPGGLYAILFKLRSIVHKLLVVVVAGLLLFDTNGMSSVTASAADTATFRYEDAQYAVRYEFTPNTGTLNDLKVVYNDSFEFFPSNFGGITNFVLAGTTLRPWEEKHTVEVLEARSVGSTYTARFRWSYNGDDMDFLVKLWLDGKTLVVEYASYGDEVAEFVVDRSELTPDPKVIELPYGHNVLFTNGVFISAITDKSISNASTNYPQFEVFSETSARYGFGGEYRQLTDGRRNTLVERIYLTVSPNIEDTFAEVHNPFSPYRTALSRTVVVDLWRNFTEYKADLQALADRGMTDLLVLMHAWQKDGYDNGLPTTVPAGAEFGGEAALLQVMDLCATNHYLCALHTNYVDFYPNSDVWDPTDIALNSDGTWIEAWLHPDTKIQSYLMKPSQALNYARLYEPEIHARYSTTASYLDVHSAIQPSDKVDFDHRVLDAGKQSATYSEYQRILSYARTTHQGPVAGEGFGASTYLWAGYVDAIEADPRGWSTVDVGGGTDVPTLVDFKLLRLHELFVPHGVGYLERFYLGKNEGYTQEELERYRATEIAFGNAGFLSNPFGKGISSSEIQREYCFMKNIQSYYLTQQPVGIHYYVQDQYMTLSDALRAVLPSTPASDMNSRLSEELGRLHIQYSDGFEIYVNRSKTRSMQVTADGTTYALPTNGFMARQPDEFLAYFAEVGGVKRDYICPAQDPCGTCPTQTNLVHLPAVAK